MNLLNSFAIIDSCNLTSSVIVMELMPSDHKNENGHIWAKMKSSNILNELHVCRECGIIRRKDGKNKPCKGKVRVTLR